MSEENFSDAPQSISELRSDKTGRAKDWSPRDALIRTLRMIDNSEMKIDVLFISFGERTDGGIKPHYMSAGAINGAETLGLVALSTAMMNKDAFEP